MDTVFEIFKIGIGPSSSHTVGPMKAARSFVNYLVDGDLLQSVTAITVDLHGSLALTGRGHKTDSAIILGLAGFEPETVDIDHIEDFLAEVSASGELTILLDTTRATIAFPEAAIQFITKSLPLHENGITFHAFNGSTECFSKTYYSTGGGFIVEAENFNQPSSQVRDAPYEFSSAEQLAALCDEHDLSISQLMMANELMYHDKKEIYVKSGRIWQVMQECIQRGTKTEGILVGSLGVSRRAAALKSRLLADTDEKKDPMVIMDWVNMFALAVSEENAAGGRVVTAPTNGAAGIIPAVLSYYNKFIKPLSEDDYTRFFMTSAAIGMLYKMNASISGAEVGCQGEIGVSCSMAAAGLTELMGGSPLVVLSAAEIAMEHHLGLTCDPVAGLVQVPCIERNAISSMKAISASRMAMQRHTAPKVSLDQVIETMYQTGKDINAKYRETSQGGLAIKVAPACS